MKTNRYKLSVFNMVKWAARVLIPGLIILIYIGHYWPALNFDIVDGFGRHSGYSLTREESIHRKTYICDIKLSYQPYKVSNTHIVSLRNGWIEQSWDGGFWHWTTYKDTGNDIYYHIVLNYTKNKLDTSEWHIINKHIPNVGYIQLQDLREQFTGTLTTLPKSDTLIYTVLKCDTIDFRRSNIEGKLIFLLQRNSLVNYNKP